MNPIYAKETYKDSSRLYAITLETANGKSVITLVVNMENVPIDPTIMQSSLEFINMRVKKFLDYGLTAELFLVQSLQNQSNTSPDTSAKKCRNKIKIKGHPARKSFQL